VNYRALVAPLRPGVTMSEAGDDVARMRGMLSGVTMVDVMAWASAAPALIIATAAVCWIPGRRAAAVDPAPAMGSESR